MNARFAKPCVCVLLINYLHFRKVQVPFSHTIYSYSSTYMAVALARAVVPWSLCLVYKLSSDMLSPFAYSCGEVYPQNDSVSALSFPGT